MKISICEVCYYEEKQLIECKYRIGFKHSIKIDVCEKHDDFFTGKTKEEAVTLYGDLLRGKKTVAVQ